MTITYSTYEAKARFSEVLRQVREGKTVTISYRGEPTAEIRPIERRKQSIEECLDQMEREGTLTRARKPRQPIRMVARVPGALERFLADRNR